MIHESREGCKHGRILAVMNDRSISSMQCTDLFILVFRCSGPTFKTLGIATLTPLHCQIARLSSLSNVFAKDVTSADNMVIEHDLPLVVFVPFS